MIRVLALLTVTVLVGPVCGQTLKDEPPLIAKLLPFIDDEAVGKELKLKPEQVRKLVDHRTKQWDEEGKDGASKAKALVALDKASVELFKDVLDAGQHKRALQLATQYVWNSGKADWLRRDGLRTTEWFAEALHEFVPVRMADPSRVPAYTLQNFREISDTLKLNEEQMKQLAAKSDVGLPRESWLFLTAEQATAAKELMGEPVKLTWREAVDPRYSSLRFGRGGPAPRPEPPALLTLTQSVDVQSDLGLAAEQVRALAAVAAKWRPERAGPGGFGGFPGGGGGFPGGGLGKGKGGRIPQGEALAKLLDETLDVMAKTLSTAQVARLSQLERQQKSGIYGQVAGSEPPLSRRIRVPEVRAALALTDEQDKKLADVEKAHADVFAKAIRAEGPVNDILKKIATVRAAREKSVAVVLTPAQWKTLDELLGPTFVGNAQPSNFGDPDGRAKDASKRRAESFAQRTLDEVRMLAEDEQVRTALGLKPEQVKKAAGLLAEKQKEFPLFGPRQSATDEEAAKNRAEETALVQTSLKELLTADQAVRFRQLVLQKAEDQLRRASYGLHPLGAIAYPGVAEEIKLTDTQKERMIAGAKAASVLTAEQRSAIEVILGAPHLGEWEPVYPAFAGKRIAPRAASVLFDNRWEAFGFTAEQTDRLAAVMNGCQAMVARVRRKPGDPPQDLAMQTAAANETFEKVVAETLTPEQANRLDQARLRALAAHSVAGFFACPEVVKALGLTAEQVKEILAVLGDVNRLRSATTKSFGVGHASSEWYQQLTEVELARASAVLTAAQRTELKKRIGDPIPNLRVALRAGTLGFPSGSSKDGL